MRSVITTVSLLIAMALGVPLAASAQDTEAEAAAPPHVITLPDAVIVGRRQQPGAEYILTRGPAGKYEVRELRTSFVREVVRTVHQRPF